MAGVSKPIEVHIEKTLLTLSRDQMRSGFADCVKFYRRSAVLEISMSVSAGYLGYTTMLSI